MRPETRDRLLAAIDNATAKLTQFSNIESVAHWLWEFSGRIHRKLENVRTREQIAALLDAEPEPSPTSISMFESIVTFAPFLLNRIVRKVAKESVRGLPENPPDPKRVTEPFQNIAICQFIGGLLAKGVSTRDAQRRAVDKWQIGFRSVERIWGKESIQKALSRPLKKPTKPFRSGGKMRVEHYVVMPNTL